MKLSVSKVSELCCVSIRTLHYYDEIGLLSPSEISESGYRYYNEEALGKLQEILFYRELDFSLENIKKIVTSPCYDKNDALDKQKSLLILKRERLDGLIKLIDKRMKGEKAMSFKEFDTKDYVKQRDKYAKEAEEKYGNSDAYKESIEKMSHYSDSEQKDVANAFSGMIGKFADLRTKEPDSEEVQKLVCEYQQFITDNYYECTDEILLGLGEMYTCDERFTENIDKHGKGTAEFMSKAIKAHFGE